MRQFIAALAITAIATAAAPGAPARQPQGPSCGAAVTASEFGEFSAAVWPRRRWRRGEPPERTKRASVRKRRCAAGPGHLAAMAARWRRDAGRFRRWHRRCAGGRVVRGRASWFTGQKTASGIYLPHPGVALNISPGTESGWYNPTTRAWLARLQRFEVHLLGHVAVLRVIDLGPAAKTLRAVDITRAGVLKLGLPLSKITDKIATARLLPGGC